MQLVLTGITISPGKRGRFLVLDEGRVGGKDKAVKVWLFPSYLVCQAHLAARTLDICDETGPEIRTCPFSRTLQPHQAPQTARGPEGGP